MQMKNLLTTILGGILLIIGFYAMSFGFSIPPNFLLFILGLLSAVFGLIIIIVFASKIETSSMESSIEQIRIPKSIRGMVKTKSATKPGEEPSEKVKTPKPMFKPRTKIKPVKTKAPKPAPMIKKAKKVETERKGILSRIRPQKTDKTEKPSPKSASELAESPKKSSEASKIVTPKKIVPVKPEKSTGAIKPKRIVPLKSEEVTDKEKKTKPIKKDDEKVIVKEEGDPQFVKERLQRLKKNYIETQDVESIIDERLDFFKGTLNKLKTESQEPTIIWSFDAGEVQDAMKDTISKAEKKVLMMYPWVRNIDVAVLKKFMDTESRMIVQEASLDDDASVELLQLLLDNQVKIRTMPHVHTVAVVADDSNGLIISTDPIYESYEVGVIYKDSKSIEEIERLFEDAWSLSKDIDLEVRR